MVQHKFQKGDRVQYSQEWLTGNGRGYKQRQGTIVGYNRNSNSAKILFDSMKSVHQYAQIFLELIPESNGFMHQIAEPEFTKDEINIRLEAEAEMLNRYEIMDQKPDPLFK